MAQQRKLRVVVLYGGRSGEHEVSLQSAASVIRNLDRSKFDIIPVGIDRDGRWLLNDLSLIENASKGAKALPLYKDQPQVVLPPNPERGEAHLVRLGPGASADASRSVDVVFPVMHGTLCEDGTIQGLLELADVPYVGCGVLASAVGMDKDVAKRLIQAAGLPIVPYLSVKRGQWEREAAALSARAASELGFPLFVKPANAGSSVGVHKVRTAADFAAAMNDAFRYDVKVLVEKAISAREVEVSVLENFEDPLNPNVSVPGEIAPSHEFYSYEAKYLDEKGAALMIPSPLEPEQTKRVQDIARRAFVALECEGMARVDMFLDKNSGELYFNEVNTIPGFTSISMYPKMWEASGIGYSELLSRLIELAMKRHARKRELTREFHAD